MLKLRPYKPCDAEKIVSWLDDKTFWLWSAGRFGATITAEDINAKYFSANGDCPEPDNFYPFTACDESGAVGHLIMRYVGEALRFGFIIVDPRKRGKGYGNEMLRLAIRYAFDILKADKITLGVFEANTAARKCYEAVGFRPVGTEEYHLPPGNLTCIEMELNK